jgi:hypothetical protein
MGKTIAEYRRQKGSIADAMTLGWREYFVRKTPDTLHPTASQKASRAENDGRGEPYPKGSLRVGPALHLSRRWRNHFWEP